MKTIFGIALLQLLCCTALSAQDFGPWSTPVNLASAVNSTCDDQHPTLSKDGLSLVFSSTHPLTPGAPCLPALHLWVAQRDSLDSPWEAPQPLTAVNSPYDSTYEDHAPNLTTDGHWLFFHSTRPGGCNSAGGRRELWVAHRENKRDDFGWELPFNLGCTLNLIGVDDAGPNFWEDDSTGSLYLYFTRNLTPTDPNGFKIHVSTCTSDLVSCNQQQLWSPAVYVTELNFVGARDTRTAIRRRDGLEMIISSNRTGTVGGLDLWVATRASAQEPWSIPLNLNQDNSDKCAAEGDSNCPVINTTFNDSAPALSWDGQTMIFWSNRAGGLGFNDLYLGEGEAKAGPLGSGGKLSSSQTCEWFAGGFHVVCRGEETGPSGKRTFLNIMAYDAEAKGYTEYGISSSGESEYSKGGSIVGNKLMFLWDGDAGEKPAKFRYTEVHVSPMLYTYKAEASVGNEPWTVIGEGKITKVK